MITFGLTGGIASGKSTVTKTFLKHNIPMVDADQVARDVVVPGSQGLTRIISNFGSDYINPDGTLDRTKLGQLVFNDPIALSDINSIMTPLINAEATLQLEEWHFLGHPIVGYDAALICEMGNSKKYRPLIVVHCSADAQLARLMSRNSLTEAEARVRIEAQMPVQEKMAMANHLIDTNGSIEDSVKQTEIIIKHLKSL